MRLVVSDKKAKVLNDENNIATLPMNKADHEEWFDRNIHHYKTLAAMVAATLKSTLDGHGISYVDIPFREKSKRSFLKKIDDKKKNKDYSPNNMTDLAGIRVITLIESDIEKVSELIHSLFNVHKDDSVNKTESLGEDKVGYRSVHFVCDIGEVREDLTEWKFLKDFCFEIQVRTALMHAWAEIEHDRGYKLGGKLPSNLARRFSLLSGLLESADLEFNRLTVEIEEYAKTLNKEIIENENLENDIELTTIGIKSLIKNKYSNQFSYNESNNEVLSDVIEELENFGIRNLNELDEHIKNSLIYLDKSKLTTEIGILRDAMLYSDIDKYFKDAWNYSSQQWHSVGEKQINCLKKRYPEKDIVNFLLSYNISSHKDGLISPYPKMK